MAGVGEDVGNESFLLDYSVVMIGRPQDTEAAPYYFTYINQVSGDDIEAVLAHQLDEFVTLFFGITEERSLHRYAPDKWSIREVLNHVSDTERALAFIIAGHLTHHARILRERY